MKQRIKNIFLVLLGVGLVLYLVITAVSDLTDKSNLHTVRLDEAAEILEIEHSINGIIPFGTDYYYIGVDDEKGESYLIKGGKNWLSKNFNSDYMAINSEGVVVKGLIKKIKDYDTERELQSRLSQLEGLEYPYGALGCMHTNYYLMAILKLVDVLLVLFGVVGWKMIRDKGLDPTSLFFKVWGFSILAALILMLVVIR